MGMEQTMEFPDMETCLEVRSSIMMQNENAEALCIPAGAEDLTMNNEPTSYHSPFRNSARATT